MELLCPKGRGKKHKVEPAAYKAKWELESGHSAQSSRYSSEDQISVPGTHTERLTTTSKFTFRSPESSSGLPRLGTHILISLPNTQMHKSFLN